MDSTPEDEIRKLIVEPAEVILAAIVRIREMRLSPPVQKHMDNDLAALALDMKRRLVRESEALRRLGRTISQFERRICEMEAESGYHHR
jgi:hypothetical protein